MQPPLNQKAHILYKMIHGYGISEQESAFNGYRSRISELKKAIPISAERRPFVNRFGKKSGYNYHYIAPENKAAAIELYKKINTP